MRITHSWFLKCYCNSAKLLSNTHSRVPWSAYRAKSTNETKVWGWNILADLERLHCEDDVKLQYKVTKILSEGFVLPITPLWTNVKHMLNWMAKKRS